MTTELNLKEESWDNKPKPTGPFDQKAIDQIESLYKQLDLKEQASNRFLKIADGEQVEVYFDMNDPETGMKLTNVLETDKTTGETVRVERERMHFVVWNEKLNTDQLWVPSNKWAKKALRAMQDFGPGLIIRREGSKMDTDYTFLPSGFKRAM